MSMRIGLYNRWLATLGGGERHSLAIAAVLARQHAVTVLSPQAVSPALIRERLGLDLSSVRFAAVATPSPPQLTALSAEYDLFINASNWDFFPARAQRNALLVFFPYIAGDTFAARLRDQVGRLLNSRPLAPQLPSLLERWAPAWGVRLRNQIPANFLEAVDTYDLLWANSQFTQRWIAHSWQRESDLLYPPVAVERFAPQPKRKRILSVGRFFAGSHNKKHDVLIEAFKALLAQGAPDWELHLAGGATPGKPHQAYLDRLRAAAAGFPVAFHIDPPLTDLIDLYGASAIYWHATGYGEDEASAPHTFEHFGITTVEAMAAGCVPVIIGRGGLPELVGDQRSGFLWYTTGELVTYTRRLVMDPALRQQMGEAARVASQHFDQAHFEARLASSLQKLGW